MLNTPPKELRENIARANGYLRRDEIERALTSMAAALRQAAAASLMRSARAEVEIHIGEFLRNLVHHKSMQPLLDPTNSGKPKNIALQTGKENALATVLEGLAKILDDARKNDIERAAQEKVERKKNLIQTGLGLLAEGQAAKGRAYLKRVAEEFGDEEGIRVQVGQIFESQNMLQEAAEIYEESMQVHPRVAAAYTGAVEAWLKLREYDRAEAAYNAILHTFGGHPNTFGKMAKMYLDWHKREKAEEMALRALQNDPAQKEAKEVMAALDG